MSHANHALPAAVSLRPLRAAAGPRRTSMALALLTAFGSAAPALAGNVIIPTGKTATELQQNGNTTDITTQTVKGGIGLNSFSRFEVDRGNLVNLHVPTNASTLLNIVYDSPILINGIVNGVKDGALGGKIVFADPHGMVVGASGVLNLGSLTVLTPARSALEGLVDSQGGVDIAGVNTLLGGDAPQSGTGVIRIDGTVNALDTIRLLGESVAINGSLRAGADVAHRAAFAGTVNTAGLAQAAGIAEHAGVIEIVAAGSATVAGSLDAAQRSAGGHGGDISVMGAHVDIGAGAGIDAAGRDGGGRIGLGTQLDGAKHAGTIDVAAGAHINADALDSGKGGTILAWGDDGNRFGGSASARGGALGGDGGLVEVSAHHGLEYAGTVDTRAPHGAMGTLLLDPDNMSVVVTRTGTDQITLDEIRAVANTNFTIKADRYLTIGTASGTTDLDLRASWTGGASTLTLDGGEVFFNSGAQLRTGGANVAVKGKHITVSKGAAIDTASGNLSLAASSLDTTNGMGDRSADASVLVNGSLKGNNLTLSATAEAKNDNTGIADALVRDATSGITGALGFRWADATATANASVRIGADATIFAAGDLAILASGAQRNKLSVTLGDTLNPYFNSVAVHGGVSGIVLADVASGAHVTAGGALSVKALNNTELEIKAAVLSYTATLGATLAYGESDLETSANIAKGAFLSAGSGLDLVSRSTSSYTVQASSSAMDSGKAGVAVALGEMKQASTATLAANIDTAGNVRVQAETIVDQNFSKASTEVGSGFAGQKLDPHLLILANGKYDLLSSGTSLIMNKLSGTMNKANTEAGGGETATTIKVGAAVSLMDDKFSSHASIGPDTVVKSGSDVVVAAHVLDKGVHSIAQSSVNSATEPAAGSTTNPAAKFSGSAGVSVAFIDHEAEATIGRNAEVTGQHIGLDSRTYQPIGITIFQDLGQWATYLSPKLGVPELVLSSYANASGEATEGALAGAVNWFSVSNDTRSWVDQNAKLTARAASDPGYLAPLEGVDAVLALPASISIRAVNTSDSIDVAGNLSAMIISGTGGGSDTKSVGGAFNGVRYNNVTVAGVDDGAVLASATGDVAVHAESSDRAFVISPSTGKGSSIGASGAAAYTYLDNHTTAALSKRAFVTAASLDVAAKESMSILTIGGAVNLSSEGAVGAGIAYNELGTNTRALIGEVGAWRHAGTGNVGGPGKVTTSGLTHVGALTDGQASALSVAGANASTPSPDKSKDDAAASSEKKAGDATDGVWAKVKNGGKKVVGVVDRVIGRNRAEAGDAPQGADPSPEPEVSFAAAGSASVNVSKLDTLATIDGSVVQASRLALAAVNNTDLVAASGSAARVAANAPSVDQSAAIAGAIAVNLEENTTRALVTDTSFTALTAADIDAWSTGQHISIGIGVAANTETKPGSASAVGSASVTRTRNSTDAGAAGSSFSFVGEAGGLHVLGYDRTDIGAGGAAATSGGEAGVGVALTYADIGNAVDAHLDGATVTGAADVTVAAAQPSRIMAGALQASKSDGDLAMGASIVVARIANRTNAAIDAQRKDGAVVKTSQVTAGKVAVVATDSPLEDGIGAELEASRARLALASRTQQSLIDFNQSVLAGQAAPKGASIIAAAGSFGSAKSAYGIAMAYSDITNTTGAVLTGSVEADAVDLRAADHARIVSVAAGVALGSKGDATGVGSASANLVDNGTNATLGASDTATTLTYRAGKDTLALSVTAEAASEIDSGAGSLASTKGNSIGAAVSYDSNDSDTGAAIKRATVVAGKGAVKVGATQNTALNTVAAALAVSNEKNSLSGSYAQNVAKDSATASVDASSIGAGSLDVLAGADASRARINALSGSGSVANGGVAVGIALAVNEIALTHRAAVTGSNVTAGPVRVHAASDAGIKSMAAGASVAEKGAVAGSSTANTITNTTTAEWSASDLNRGLAGAGSTLDLDARDESDIDGLAGGGAITTKGASAGLAVAVNRIDNSVRADLLGGAVNGHASAVRAQSVMVNAASSENINAIAIGLAFTGGELGIGGSSAIGISGSTTAARIDAGADVVATRNVGVIATNDNALSSFAGAGGIGMKGGGLGVSTSFNLLLDETSATIGSQDGSGPMTYVTALGQDAADRMEVRSGRLENDVSLLDGLTSGASFIDADLDETTRSVTGLAVNASSHAAIGSAALSVGGGKEAGLSGTFSTNLIGGTTLAQIKRATINGPATGTPAAGSSVDVQASSHAASSNLNGAVAGSAGLSAGLAVDTEIVSATTTARVADSNVVAGALSVDARHSATIASLGAGVAVGKAGGAGTGLIAELKGVTKAELAGGSANAASVAVRAASHATADQIGGAIGGGSSVGIGGIFSLIHNHQQTDAAIGDTDGDGSLRATRVTSSGDVTVDADSQVDNHIYGAAIGAGGTVGVGLTAGVILNENTTRARVANVTDPVLSGLSAGGALRVTASELDRSVQGIGALGVGITAAGVGASVAVTESRAQVTAQIVDSRTSSASLQVEAVNEQDHGSTAISVGAGAYAGVGGAVSVVQLGSGSSGGTTGVLGSGGALGNISALLANDNGGDTSSLTAAERTSQQRPSLDADGLLATGSRNSAKALVGGSRVTTTSGDADVKAAARSSIASTAGAGGAGLAGVGGSAAVGTMFNAVEAGIDAGSTLQVAGKLRVEAASGDRGAHGVKGMAIAGAAGAVGVGAAVGVAIVDNAVLANAGGTLAAGQSVAVKADDTSTIDLQAVSVAAGAGGAVGLTFAEAEKRGGVRASVNPAASNGVRQSGSVGAPVLDVAASSAGLVEAEADVGAAGIGFAAGANHARAKDSTNVTADVGAGSSVNAQSTNVTAKRTPQVKATTLGVGVSGSLQVGASVSEALITGGTVAAVGDGSRFGGVFGTAAKPQFGTLSVSAQNLVAAGGYSADADAMSSGGGVLAGINGAGAVADNDTSVSTLVGNDVVLPMSDVDIDAQADSRQRANASGVAVGGVAGVGIDVATASSSIDTTATLGARASSAMYLPGLAQRGGDLSVTARGGDDNRASAKSGSGGLLAGAAAAAVSTTGGSTTAQVLGGTATQLAVLGADGKLTMAALDAGTVPSLRAGSIDIDSSHATTFFSKSDATQGSAAGGSGANSQGNVDVTVSSKVGDGARLQAADISVGALNKVVQAGDGTSATGVSGGVVAGAGMSSVNTITTTTTAAVGKNAQLSVTGNPLDQPGNLHIGAGNITAVNDYVSVDSGGLFAGLTAESRTQVNAGNSVDIGSGAVLETVGDLELGTFSQALVNTSADAHGYGLAGGAGGKAHSRITVNQNVNIGAGAQLDSWGNMTIASGRAPLAAYQNSLTANANNQVYFDGAFNGADPEARANVTNNGGVNIAAGAELTSVRNIRLATLAGVADARAVGQGHYRILGVPMSNKDQSADKDGTQRVEMNGSAIAGTRHEVALSVDRDGKVKQQLNLGGLRTLDSYNPISQLNSQIGALTALRDATGDAATRTDIDGQITALSGLRTTLLGRGLSDTQPVKAIEVLDTLAAGGNITVDSASFAGSGKLEAWGGPTITLTNESDRFLVVDRLFIPNELGGNVRFDGGAQQATGVSVTQHGANAAASITIKNTYDSSMPGANPVAPAIFLTNSIENAGGSLSVLNKSGDLGQFGAVSVNNASILVPNGAYIVNTPRDGVFLNGDPRAQYVSMAGTVYDLSWDSGLANAMLGVGLPGGARPLDNEGSMISIGSHQSDDYDGGQGTPGTADEAVTYVANYVARQRGYNGSTNQQLGSFLAGSPGYGTSPSGGTGTMFFYQGSALEAQSSLDYRVRYGADTGFYHDDDGNARYYYPSVGQRTLEHSITTLTPGKPADPAKITQVGTTAIINAKYVDINGTIKAGLASDFSVSIKPQTIQAGIDAQGRSITRDLIACIDDLACRPYAGNSLAANGMYRIPGTAVLQAGDTPIDVYYDPASRQLMLQNISGGGGGSVTIQGAIINTNAGGNGKILVSNGYAQVKVDNQTGTTLMTRDINTGNGNVGLVKVTDTLKADWAGRPLTTWYVNRLGQGTSTYQSNTATDYAGLTPIGSTSGSTAQYNPQAGTRYWWNYDANLTRSFDRGSGNWWNATSGSWRWDRVPTNEANSLGGVWRISSGLENRGDLAGTQFHEAISGYINNFQRHEIDYIANGAWSWKWDVVTGVHITAHNSVKADNAIGIGFTGSHTSGLVDVGSKGSVVVGGNIQNIGGATILRATGAGARIDANASGVVNTQSLDLQAAGGIGSLANPFTATLTRPAGSDAAGNTVKAVTAQGDIGLSLKGVDAKIANVSAGATGDVLLRASGNLDNAAGSAGSAVVSGRNLDIISDNGAVGSAAPLTIHAISTTNQAGAATGGIVDASGRTGVGLHQLGGDLYIGHVSSPGEVTLIADGGLRDGRNLAGADRSAEQAAVWDRLHLKAGNPSSASVDAFVRNTNAQYGSYWSLMELGSVVGGSFVLDANGVAVLQRQADALGVEVHQYAADRHASLRTALGEAGVHSLDAYDRNFVFKASSSDVARLTEGQYWNDEELLYQINDAALAPASGALVTVNEAGVTGGRVNLVSLGSDVGSLAAPVSFDLRGGLSANLSTAQKAALASATSAGDLTNQVFMRNNLIDAACTLAQDGCRLVGFDIRQTRAIEVDVKDGLRASGADVYLAAKGSLPIERIEASGNARIASESGMTDVGSGGSAIHTGADLVLQNGSGSIGGPFRYLTIETGGKLAAARSGSSVAGDMYLEAASGNLRFNDLFAGGQVALRTRDTGAGQGDIVSVNAVNGKAMPSIAARTLLLGASGSVYQEAGGRRQALVTRLADDGAAGNLSGVVAGNIDLSNETALRLDQLGVLGRADLGTATGDLEAAYVEGPNLNLWTGSGRIVGGPPSTPSGENIHSTGTVTLNGGSQGAASNTRGGGIGTDAASRLVVAARELDATSAVGDLFLALSDAAGDVSVRMAGAAGSLVDIVSDSDYTVTSVSSAKGAGSGQDGDSGADIRLGSLGNAVVTLKGVDAGRDLYLEAIDGKFVLDQSSTVNVARDLRLTMTGNGTMDDDFAGGSAGTLTAGRDILMNAAGLALGDLAASRNIDLTARSGDIAYRNLTARGGDVFGFAGGSIAGSATGSLRALGDARLTATALGLGALEVGRDAGFTVNGGSFATHAPGSIGRDLALHSTGGNTVSEPLAANLRVARDIAIDAAAIDGVRADAGRDLRLTARSGDIGYAQLLARAGSVQANASGRIDGAAGATLDAALDVHLSAATITVASANAGRDIGVDAGSAVLGKLAAGRDLTLDASGSLALADAAVGGDVRLQAGNAAFGDIAAAGGARMTTSAGLTGSGVLKADAVVIDAGGAVRLNAVEARDAIGMHAGGELQLAQLASQGTARLDADGDVRIGSAQLGADLEVTTGAALSLDDAHAGGDIALDGQALALGTLAAAGDFSARAATLAATRLQAGRELETTANSQSLGEVRAGTLARLSATVGGITADRVQATDLGIDATGDIALREAGSSAASAIAAGGAISVDRLASVGALVVGAGTAARIGTLTVGDTAHASNFAARSGASLTVGDAEVRGQLLATAATVDLGAVRVGGDADLTAAGTLRAGQLAVAGALDARAGTSLQLGSVQAGGSASLASTTGDITGGKLQAARVTIAAGRDLRLDEVASSGATDIEAGGAVALERLASTGALDLAAATDARVTTLAVGDAAHASDMAAQAGGSLSVGDGEVWGNLAGSGAAIALDKLRVHGDAALTAGQALRVGQLAVGGALDARAGTSLQLGSVQAGGSASLASTTGDITGGKLQAQRVTLAAGRDLRLDDVASSGATDIEAGGAVALERLASTGALDLAAATDARVTSLAVGDAAHASGMAAQAGGSLSVGDGEVWGGMTAAGRAIDLGSLRVHGNAALAARDTLRAGQLAVGGALQARAGSNLQLDAVDAASATLAAADMGLGKVRTDGALLLAAARDLRYDDLRAGGDVDATAGGAFTGSPASVLAAGRDLRVDAGTLNAGAVDAGRDASLEAAGALTAGAIRAANDLSLVSGGVVKAASLRAGNTLSVEGAGGLDIGAMWATSLNSTTPGVLRIGELTLGKSATLAAPVIDVGLRQGPDGALTLVIDGYRGAVADKVDLRADAPSGLTFASLRANTARISSTSHTNRIDRGYVTGTLEIASPDALLWMNNNSAATKPGASMQLYAPGYGFMLQQRADQFLTDAWVTRYDSTVRPTVPNYQESHRDGEVMVFGASAERDLDRHAGANVKDGAKDSLARVALPAAASAPFYGVAQPQDVAVNLGTGSSSAREEDILLDIKPIGD